MPKVESGYRNPKLLKNSHLHTIFCAVMRTRLKIAYIRERLELNDGDFVDLDWSPIDSKKLLILTHGMEGSSRSKYILHSVKEANANGFSALAWNMRGCSGESNRKLHFYHSGKTEDLEAVIRHAIAKGYREIYLAGFSLGGNLTLLYLGRAGKNLPRVVKSAVAISAPVDLDKSGERIELSENRIYLLRFLKEFRAKFIRKRHTRRIYIDTAKFHRKIKTLAQLDAKYTAPWNGFPDEKTYYAKSSSLPVLENIHIPFLLMNPKDDPFLSKECYPYEIAAKSGNFFLETPEYGGHCAMLIDYRFRDSYMEKRVIQFFNEADAKRNLRKKF